MKKDCTGAILFSIVIKESSFKKLHVSITIQNEFAWWPC